MRDELAELQRKIGKTAVYVTHDQEEAMAIADRIVLMNKGHIEQEAAPEELYRLPRTAFAAQFLGRSNLLSGRSEEHTSELQSLMRISYAVFCLKKKKNIN